MSTYLPHRLRVAKVFGLEDAECIFDAVVCDLADGEHAILSIDDIAVAVGNVLEAWLKYAANMALFDESVLSNTAA